jgi:hypothetical protein
MAEAETPDIELIRKLVVYQPDTGKFFFLPRTSSTCARHRSFNARFAGMETGLVRNEKGYLCLTLFNKKHKAHRVAYALMTGQWPEEIDHINGVRSDNRWCNLRNVSRRENRANTYGWSKPTKSQFIGVTKHKAGSSWIAQATMDYKNHYIGSFPTEEEAALARDAFVLSWCKHKPRLNFPVKEKENG